MSDEDKQTIDHLDRIGWENWTEEDWETFFRIKDEQDRRKG